ncbi:hypothetical protein [Halostella pelagica]|uniref:hypothetical protein n=1 Tax=Halostella pelagica TaxID=2583824 RepID=UPI00107FE968|nr:hypothetical protein [Halostella pelagica]
MVVVPTVDGISTVPGTATAEWVVDSVLIVVAVTGATPGLRVADSPFDVVVALVAMAVVEPATRDAACPVVVVPPVSDMMACGVVTSFDEALVAEVWSVFRSTR